MKKCYQAIIFFMLVFFWQPWQINAQQLPIFNQYSNSGNPAYISPAYFKYNTPTTATVRYRYQWTKIKDAPRTLSGSFSHLDEATNFSYGGDFISDKTGPTGFTGVYGRASYGIQLSNDLLLSFGLRGGATQYRVQGNNLNFLMAGDLANNSITKIYPDFSLGTMLYYKEHYYIGFSIPQVFSLALNFKDDVNTYNIKRVRHYYGIVGTRFDLGSDSWLEGSVDARYIENTPFYLNAKIEYEFRQIFWININGSKSKEAGIGFGAIANVGNGNLVKFGYDFSNYYQTYGPGFGTVHELGVQIHL